MIHACPKRIWYVNDYLVPSLLKQGIKKKDIVVYNDTEHKGNLKACMDAFLSTGSDDKGTWHLQDDVVICHDFKERSEKYDNGNSITCGIVCAFSSQMYDGIGRYGTVNQKDMWFSFPCIYIPNKLAKECANWVYTYLIGNPVYRQYWESGVNDDWAFKLFVGTYYKDMNVYNLKPNLVDHVDFLLGGSSLDKPTRYCRAQYFNDTYLVDELEKQLTK